MSGHPLFDAYPLTGQVPLSTGTAPTPYHVYDGYGLLLVGTCDADALGQVFEGQDVHPVLTASGKSILNLFLCNFEQASHGAHLEFHITAFAAPEPGEIIPDDPAAALTALARRRDWGVLSLHLWNDTAEVVAYNNEYLGLSAKTCDGFLRREGKRFKIDLKDSEGAPLIKGNVRLNPRSDSGLMLRVLRHLGWSGFLDAVRRKPTVAHVINRKGPVIPRNGRARTLTAPDTMIVTAFDGEQDELDLSRSPLAAYGFKPQILEHVSPFRFVYLHPDDSGPA